MRKRNTPGMAISIIKDNRTLYSKGFGARNLKQQEPMDADTLLGIGSITKSFTAFAIMQLQDRGQLSIEDSAAKYLNVEPFVSRPEIKIKHMLSHASGVPSMDAGMLSFNYTFGDFSRIYPASNREDFLAHLADAEEFTLFKPGEKFFYNNDMYTCLAFIVEEITGLNFEQFVQANILNPLEMTRAVLSKSAFDADDNRMTGYLLEMKNGKSCAKESDVPIDGYLQAPGGLYVSMNEMLNYAKCLLNHGEFNGTQILSKESVATLFASQIATPYGEGNNPQYALGWCIESPTNFVPYGVLQHGGGMGTSNSFLLLIPELNAAVVAAENAGTGITPLIARVAVAELLGDKPEVVVEDLRMDLCLAEVEGTYQSQYDMYKLTVGRKNGVLQADVETDDGSFSFPLIPSDIDNLEFSVYSLRSSRHAKVVFYRDEKTQKIAFSRYDRFMYRRV